MRKQARRIARFTGVVAIPAIGAKVVSGIGSAQFGPSVFTGYADLMPAAGTTMGIGTVFKAMRPLTKVRFGRKRRKR